MSPAPEGELIFSAQTTIGCHIQGTRVDASARTSCQGPRVLVLTMSIIIKYVYERSSQIRIVASQVTACSCRERTI
jgi:hypothetical protein